MHQTWPPVSYPHCIQPRQRCTSESREHCIPVSRCTRLSMESHLGTMGTRSLKERQFLSARSRRGCGRRAGGGPLNAGVCALMHALHASAASIGSEALTPPLFASTKRPPAVTSSVA